MKFVVVIKLLLILGGAQAATMVNKEQVDLPSFLQTITNLRTKLLNLLGNSDPSDDNNKNLNKENLLLAHDLVSDSIFDEEQEKKAEKNSLFENMEAMPAHLGGKEPSTRSHQDPSKEVCGKSVLDPKFTPRKFQFYNPTNKPVWDRACTFLSTDVRAYVRTRNIY